MAVYNIKNLKPVILISMVFFLLSSSTAYSQQSLVPITKYYTPEHDAPFFKIGNDIEVINNLILILENPKHYILSYSINNKDQLIFNGYFVKEGQGPGETALPIQMSFWEDKLAIIDSIGCSIFSKEGKFLSKFRIFTGKISFVYTANRIYLANQNPNSSYLIDVYSPEGKKLFQFGENLLPINYEVQNNLNRGYVKYIFYSGNLVSDGKKIFYFNNKFGRVSVFDLEGKSLETKSITSYFDPKESSEILDWNNKMLKNGIKESTDKNGATSVVSKIFFKDIYLCNDKIYILNSMSECFKNPHIKIRVLNNDTLELVNTLIIKKNSAEDFIRSLSVQEENGKAVIFAAMDTQEGTVIAKFKE